MASLFSDGERRQQLRQLDDCLETLEREHERGGTRVTGPLAEVLRERVGTVRSGMLIIDAIDEVLIAQAPLLADGAESARSPRPRRSYLPRHKRDTFYENADHELVHVAESA